MLNELREQIKTAFAMNHKMMMALLGIGGLGAAAAWGIPKAQAATKGWNQNIGGRQRMMQGYVNSMSGAPAGGTISGILPNLRQHAMSSMTGQ